ncbi:MAG TPA: YlbF family regulator [Candidatus Fimenecus stercoravium]|nr:YlbF family regulator [Candidatus Fimenecus stercoravium]
MDIETLTRQLGAAIQQDETYLAYAAAKEANDADEALNALMGKIRLVQLNYQQEAAKESPDEQKMNEYNREFQAVYNQIMANEHMQAFETARQAVDDMMNRITGILAMCVNGEDPQTCDPAAHNCSGDCGSCGGCH